MLAGTISTIANDFVEEYASFSIINHLNEATAISAQRNPTQPQTYQGRAQQLRVWAENVIQKSRFNNYPHFLLRIIDNSSYKAILPSRIASILRDGFPHDLQYAMSSTEVSVYVNTANTLISQLAALRSACNQFGIEDHFVPEGLFGLEIMIPRGAFENSATEFNFHISHFLNSAKYINEIISGSASEPKLTYISTSDPIFGFAMIAGSVLAFLQFYKLLLEVADKQLSLIKTFKEFRKSELSDSTDNLDDKLRAMIERATTEAVERAISQITASVDSGRVNQIRIALLKDARAIVNIIGKGGRLHISQESLQHNGQADAEGDDEAQELIKFCHDVRLIEDNITAQATMIENADFTLLVHRPE